MRVNTLILSALCAITLCVATGCGPRNASLSQSILGEWKIVETFSPEIFEGDSSMYKRGTVYKFHTDHKYDIFMSSSTMVSGIWDAEKSETNVGLNAESQKMNVAVEIKNQAMIWSIEDTTDAELPPLAKITFVKTKSF